MRNRLIPILLVLALGVLGLAVYVGMTRKNTDNPVQTQSENHPAYWPSKRGLSTVKPSVNISDDGLSCTVVVPADASDGVEAKDKTSGKQFVINQDDEIEIVAEGSVEFGSDHPIVGPEGETTGYWDKSVDSPFYDKVGGLEFSIGPLGANRYFAGRYYHSKAEYSGIPIFRMIESVNGYHDGNYGAFSVMVKILHRR